MPSDLMILQIKNIVISFLALSIGLNSLIRALSKKCTEEDISSKINVRNSKERNFNDDEIITTGSNYSCKNFIIKRFSISAYYIVIYVQR